MITAQTLLSEWLDMLAAAADPKAFRNAQALFVKSYKRVDHAMQGAFHQLLAADHKRHELQCSDT